MDHLKISEILKEVKAIIDKMCIDYSNLVYKSGYPELSRDPMKSTYFRLGENITRIKVVAEEGNLKRRFMNFYYLSLLKRHQVFRYMREKINNDFERFEFWKNSKKAPVTKDASFYRFCAMLGELKKDCADLERAIDRSYALIGTMKKEFYSIVRKNHRARYRKSLKRDGHAITYDIPISVRFAYGNDFHEEEMVSTLDYFVMDDDFKLDMQMLNDCVFFIEAALDRIFMRNATLFQPIYGNKISFNLNVNLVELTDASGNVLGTITRNIGNQLVSHLKYDGACKDLEISMNSRMVFESFRNNDSRELEDTFIHEFNHLYDSKIARFDKNDIIRSEGIARFSEIVFNNSKPYISDKTILHFKKDPLNSVLVYEQSAARDSQIPYRLGAYMCYKMFLHYLMQNPDTRPYVANTAYIKDQDSRLSRLIKEPIIRKAGENFIKSARMMNAVQFYTYYLKSEDSEPIITEDFLKMFIK